MPHARSSTTLGCEQGEPSGAQTPSPASSPWGTAPASRTSAGTTEASSTAPDEGGDGVPLSDVVDEGEGFDGTDVDVSVGTDVAGFVVARPSPGAASTEANAPGRGTAGSLVGTAGTSSDASMPSTP
jgi:hypothetical protein